MSDMSKCTFFIYILYPYSFVSDVKIFFLHFVKIFSMYFVRVEKFFVSSNCLKKNALTMNSFPKSLMKFNIEQQMIFCWLIFFLTVNLTFLIDKIFFNDFWLPMGFTWSATIVRSYAFESCFAVLKKQRTVLLSYLVLIVVVCLWHSISV